MRKGTVAIALMAAFGMFALTGCGEKTSGEKADDAMEKAGDDADEAAGDMDKAADDAKKAVDEGADDAKNAIDGLKKK